MLVLIWYVFRDSTHGRKQCIIRTTYSVFNQLNGLDNYKWIRLTQLVMTWSIIWLLAVTYKLSDYLLRQWTPLKSMSDLYDKNILSQTVVVQ